MIEKNELEMMEEFEENLMYGINISSTPPTKLPNYKTGMSPDYYTIITRGSGKIKTFRSILDHSLLIQSKEGRCDYVKNAKPCYIKYKDNSRALVITHNKHAYLTYSDTYPYKDKPYIWNIIDPKHYTFNRFLRGHDF